MALQFQGAPEWLLQEYINRKQPLEIASEGISNSVKGYADYKTQQQQMASLDASRKANEFKAVADYIPENQIPTVAKQYGINIPTAQAPGPVATSSGMPTGLEQSSRMSIQSEHPDIQPGSPIHASLTAGHPDLTGLLNRPVPTSKAGKAKYKSDIDMAKTVQSIGNKPVITDEQALAQGFIPPNAERINPKDTSTKDTKYSNEQDKLEQQAIDRISKLRGDSSLARVETQRDAAIQAYNTIDRIQKEGRAPSQLEYYDLLGQMWKARTGASPTDQALRDLDAKTLKGDIGKAYQYFSGKPAGITTQDVLNNVKQFAVDSGLQADKFHGSYMNSHRIKPSGLEDQRWNPIFNTARGLGFAEGTGYQPSGNAEQSNIPTISDDATFKSLPPGSQFKDPSGQVHRKK